ncbi:MAG: TrmH family RNA methyltransferase, partial [bacterium]
MTIRKLAAQPLSRRLRWYIRLLDAWSGSLSPDAPASMAGITLPGGAVSIEGLLTLIRQDSRDTHHAQDAAASLAYLRPACTDANELRRAIDTLRHALLADFQIHGRVDPPAPAEVAQSDALRGFCFPGTAVLAEDLRSPYNTGSIIRSTEAFGMERCMLVGSLVDSDHPRLLRASMGAQRHVNVERFD